MADVVVAAVTLHQRQSIVTKTVRITKTTEGGKKRKRVNNYLLLNHLGEGAFGKVEKVIDHNGVEWAMKILNRRMLRKKRYREGTL